MFFSVDRLKTDHEFHEDDFHVWNHHRSKVKFQPKRAVINCKQTFMLTKLANIKHVGGWVKSMWRWKVFAGGKHISAALSITWKKAVTSGIVCQYLFHVFYFGKSLFHLYISTTVSMCMYLIVYLCVLEFAMDTTFNIKHYF